VIVQVRGISPPNLCETPNQFSLPNRVLREEVVDFALGLIAGISISFLKAAHEFFGVARGPIEIVVSQLPPPRLHFTLQLMPLTFQHISIHGYVLSFL